MRRLLYTVLSRVSQSVFTPYVTVLLDLLRIEAAAEVVRGVRVLRMLFLSGLATALMVVLATAGFVLVHFALYALLPVPANSIVMLALGALYLLTAILVLRWISLEKTWLKYSGAKRGMDQATGKVPRD
ncbi:MAG: hypothetical protein H6678_07995 [Candidatus Delongbacteria bacterium]|nr:hypothetical protein [Candidatus Delongbacteria bacterium]